ncbi:MAG: CRISPR-associated endoribonuclease Cas6 [Candidatus Heimdallarchaeota archaeon]|nr:CRISPR-associated endoribonuclease Cas6 [Candidatus Heimdallarchaeota archaeon]
MVNKLYNFEFILKAKTKCLLPSFTGQLVRGAILQTIKEFDSTLSEMLHEGNEMRPYSVSPLIPYDKQLNRSRRREIILEEESTLKFRLGILTRDLVERMVKLTLRSDEMKLQLAEGEFRVVSIEIKKKNIKELLMEGQQPLTTFSLSFLTPTYFNIAKQEFPMRFPDPRYVFMNLATLWNTFNEEKIFVDQTELFSWLESHISINAYNLSTHSVYIAKNAPKIGFKGWVRYQLSGDESYQRWIHALAQYAEFSNVGANRTAGLGCVSYRKEE